MTSPQTSDLDHHRWLKKAGLDSFARLNVLDLGCGTGYLCHLAKKQGALTVVGIDLIEPKDWQREAWKFLPLNLDEKDWESGLSDQKFDLILAFDILEHLSSPYLFLKSCHSLMSKQGTLVLTTPNLLSWERYANPLDWSGARDPQHKILFTKYSLEFLLRKAGFSQISLQSPLRRLSFLGPLQPHIGGQIFCTARL